MAVPTRDAIREWIGVPTSSVSDDQLDGVIAAELAAQARICLVPDPMPPDLAQSLLRRVARVVGARMVPLGMTDGEFGSARLPTYDAEITRLEGPHRRVVLG